MKRDIEARLNRLEARQFTNGQASVVLAGRGTFQSYAKAHTGLGRSVTLASPEDEVTSSPAQQHAAEHRQQRATGAGVGIGMHAHPSQEAKYRQAQAPTYLRRQGYHESGIQSWQLRASKARKCTLVLVLHSVIERSDFFTPGSNRGRNQWVLMVWRH